jgi:hypothetical protein
MITPKKSIKLGFHNDFYAQKKQWEKVGNF